MLIDGALIHPARTVRNLCVFIDADPVKRTHVTRVIVRCFAVVHRRSPLPLNNVDAGRGASFIPARLNEQCAGWSTSSLDEASPVGAQ
jgi:hypothetical protein